MLAKYPFGGKFQPFIFKLIEDSLVKNGVIDDDNADIVREIKLFKQDVFDGVLVNIMRFE